MKQILQNKQAITMVSLVITVIVIIILAGVTLYLAVGPNGFITNARKGNDDYFASENNEVDQSHQYANTIDNTVAGLLYTPQLTLFSSVAKPGDYVKYDTGEHGVLLFRVLYDASSPYGVQIMSDENVKNVTLGSTTWEKATESYNNAIFLLNQEALPYLNKKYAIDARCVGSVPSDKNAENKTTVVISGEYTPPAGVDKNTNLKDEDRNSEADMLAIQNSNIEITSTPFWLASRSISRQSNIYMFYLLSLVTPNSKQALSICTFFLSLIPNEATCGFRPCITLNPRVIVTKGDGKTAQTAYEIAI